MKYIKFKIKNFKGINSLVLDLTKQPNGEIFPLVGLNESGKTTILEAIDLFQNKIEGSEHEMIHKNKKANFNDVVTIKATLKLGNDDKKFIESFLLKKKLELEKEIDEISITKKYKFKDSKFIDRGFSVLWNIDLKVKTKQAKNFVDMYDRYNEHWDALTTEIKEKLIPKILYFENFLFDFPDKIYLENIENSELTKTDTQKEYRKILQDILSSIDESYNLNKHILDRLKSTSEDDEESAKQILNEMSQKLNSVIVQSWQQIFSNSTRKNIEIEHNKDTNGYFLQFKIKEGASSFYINEMSLGFRWYFGFLLFTEFRKARQTEKGEYLFLFDEPASNLHQGSQQKLLKLFEKLIDRSKIIYSTHSHYLLNPKFLLTSFVVKDKGRKEDSSGVIDMENYSQNIDAELYRNFVANNENEETHFQPILDCLEYIKNPFEQTKNIVFTEGKFDYYTFKWVKEQFFNDDYDFNFYPGAGVDKHENIFREYLANNKKFIAIFDDDIPGKRAKKNYLNNVSEELKKHIFTLKEIKENFSNFQTEKLFHTSAERLRIQKLSFPDSVEYEKSKFNTAIQELFIKGESFNLLNTTKKNFKEIFNFIKDKLES